MSLDSREHKPPHARDAERAVKLSPGHAPELCAFLRANDVWPTPREADLIAFLGREDAITVACFSHGRIVGAVASVLDHTVMSIVWAIVEPESGRMAGPLLAEAEKFARARRAAILFAQALEDSKTHRLLADYGFAVNYKERDVAAGHPASRVELTKTLT
jgi:hypothetical protein